MQRSVLVTVDDQTRFYRRHSSQKLGQPIKQAPRRRPARVHEDVETGDQLFAPLGVGKDAAVVG